MKILKTKKFFTYLVVGALVMALSISCKSNEEPSSGPKAGTNPSAGTYTSRSTLDGKVGSEKASATVTHNGNGCTITGKLQGVKLPTGSETEATYKAVDFSITVNSWYEGDGYTYAGDDSVLTSPSGRIGNIQWGYSDDGTAYILLGISYDDGFISGDTLYYGN